jgi:hypothetical protein
LTFCTRVPRPSLTALRMRGTLTGMGGASYFLVAYQKAAPESRHTRKQFDSVAALVCSSAESN